MATRRKSHGEIVELPSEACSRLSCDATWVFASGCQAILTHSGLEGRRPIQSGAHDRTASYMKGDERLLPRIRPRSRSGSLDPYRLRDEQVSLARAYLEHHLGRLFRGTPFEIRDLPHTHDPVGEIHRALVGREVGAILREGPPADGASVADQPHPR